MQFIKNRFAQTNRAIEDMAAYFAANCITLFADVVDKFYHFLGCGRVGATDDVLLALVDKFLYIAYIHVRRVDFPHATYMGGNFNTLAF